MSYKSRCVYREPVTMNQMPADVRPDLGEVEEYP